jgi:GGDEF domain-containing protein
MPFDPNSARPLEFDPASAEPAEFDPSTAEEATASWGDTLQAVPEQIRGGAAQSVGGMARAAAAPAQRDPLNNLLVGPLRAAAELPSLYKKAGHAIAGEENLQALDEFGKNVHEFGTAKIEANTPENQTFWQKAVSTAGVSAGTMVPTGLAAFITKQPGLVAGSFGAQEFGRAWGDAKAKGLDDVQAARHATASGLLEAGTEYLPAKQLFKAGSGPFKRLVNFMARELPGENIAELGQMVSERINGLDDEITGQQVLDTVLLTSAATMIGGSAQSAAASGVDALTRPKAQPEKPQEPDLETTLAGIANATDEELDAMVDEYLAEPDQDLPVPDIEAFNEEVAASEAAPESSTSPAALKEIPQNVPRDQPKADRRQDPKRAVFDSLPPEQRDILLRSDVIPSLPSKRAFEFHMEENPGKRVMFFDFDDFKPVNDKYGEKETDRAVLEPSGKLINEVLAKFPDIKGFHRSGDEFMATGASDERLEEFATALRERLKTAKLEAILPDGSTDTLDGIEFSYGIDQDEETSRAASKRQKAERKASGERTGARDSAGLGEQAPAGDQVQTGSVAFDPATAQPNERPPQYISPKLKRLHYRGQLKVLSDSLERNSGGQLVGGDFSPINDEVARGQETEVHRLPSMNPDWFKSMAANPDTAMSVAEVQKAVDKALKGEKLGVRQARVVETMLGEIEGKRTEPDQIQSVKKELAMARQLRELAAKGAPPHVLERIPAEFYENAGELFEESEYPAEWTGSARSLFELATMAQEAGFGDQVEAILGKDLPDADAARQLFELTEGRNNGTQQQGRAEETAEQQETGTPAEAPEAQQTAVLKPAQTDTPEFRRWFGDSKVVDEAGKPLVVYHGTDADFDTFRDSFAGPAGEGFYFGDKDTAGRYGANIMPVYLSIKNPAGDVELDRIENLTDKEIGESLRKDGYDGVISESRSIYVAFHPSQIKSAIGNRGTFDEADPNILHANPLAAVYKGYQRLATGVLTRVHDAIGWKMTPLGKLPAQQLYLKDRYETLGKIADVEAISKRVWETFGPLDAREAELVYDYFTTKGADPAKLSNKPVKYTWKGNKVESTVRQQAETIKKLIDKVGQNLVDRGLLHKDSYDKYEDAYLPRVYLKHIMGDGVGRSFAGGKKPSDLGYLKERKDIPKDIREIILGEVTDPGYLASKSLGKSMRDIAILDWFDQMAQNPDWALQDFLVDYKGKKVSIFWLKAEGARIKEQIPYYTPANQQRATQIVQQIDALVQAGEAKLGKVTDAYRQVPDNARYGRLRGMYIRKEIFNDIVGIPGNRDPNAEWWEAPLEYGGIGTKVTQLWKMSKVALNPPTQIRNFISNGILLQLSGVGSHRVLPLMTQAIQEIRQNGKHFRIAKKYGVTGSTFANNELYKIERELLDLKAKNAGKLSMAQVKRAGAIIAETAGDMYQLSEQIWKTAKIIDAMKREGKDEVAAVLDAQKWLYDYSLVPQTVRYFRNTPIGVPFLTFYYKTLPRMLEVLATAPHRFAPYVAIPALFVAAICETYDVEPEDVEKLKLALPEWLRDHGHLFFLPYKDQHGRWQAFDFSYLLPWSMFEQTMNNLKEGQVGEAVSTAGVFNGPITGIIAPIVTGGIDPFTKKPIVDKSDPPAQQVASIMNYLWSLGAPTWLTANGAIKKMYDSIMGNVDPKTGDPQLTLPQAALRLGGLNLYPIEPEESRRKNISFMELEIKEVAERMAQKLRDKTLTMEDKRKIREVYMELIREKKEQLKDYRDNSKIHPNLKGEPINKDANDSGSA